MDFNYILWIFLSLGGSEGLWRVGMVLREKFCGWGVLLLVSRKNYYQSTEITTCPNCNLVIIG